MSIASSGETLALSALLADAFDLLLRGQALQPVDAAMYGARSAANAVSSSRQEPT